MSEGSAGPATGPSGAAAPDGNGVAIGLALQNSPADETAAFLKDQRQLAADQRAMLHLQMEEMRQRNAYDLSHLRLRRFSGWAKAAFEFSVGLIALALVGGIGAMVWNAAHSEGLVVESFAVPPDLAVRGLGGQVVAGQLIDRLAEFQANTNSLRAAKSYGNNWGDDIKVEIPQTGVSIGEAYRFLKNWLGHETHVTGEVFKTENGFTVTARVSGGAGSSISGGELDTLIQKTAENIYSRTQPYRYASYLRRAGRLEEGLAIYKSLALTGPESERGWGLIGWSNALVDSATLQERNRLLVEAQRYGLATASFNLSNGENALGHAELSLAMLRKSREALRSDNGIDPAAAPAMATQIDSVEAAVRGDYHAALQATADYIGANLPGSTQQPTFLLAMAQISAHDLAAARATLANPIPYPSTNALNEQVNELNIATRLAMAAGDWQGAYDIDRKSIALTRSSRGRVAARRTVLAGDPRTSVLAAQLGKYAEAEALLRSMPADCYQCLRARAQVAALRQQNPRADWLHWQNEVKQARLSLREEMAFNNAAFATRIAFNDCIVRQVNEAAAILDDLEAGRAPRTFTLFRPGAGRLLVDSEWQSQRASQTLTHFPHAELAPMSRYYALLPDFRFFFTGEGDAWQQLGVLRRPPRGITTSDLIQLRVNLSIAERMHRLAMLNARRQLRISEDLGMAAAKADPVLVRNFCTMKDEDYLSFVAEQQLR